MSSAGTPSSDPWVVLAREKARYEEHFKALKPINGIVTGDQAKEFLLQSQLPPLILGQIWALADTDADGKMDINEFSIACKLINLKLRGFEIPRVLPQNLMASLKTQTPPAIPPLPNASLINPPPRPEPPKVVPIINQQPLIQTQPLSSNTQPLVPNLSGSLINQIPPVSSSIPTGIVPPMQSSMGMSYGVSTANGMSMAPTMQTQPLISGVPPLNIQTYAQPTMTPFQPLNLSGNSVLQQSIGNFAPPASNTQSGISTAPVSNIPLVTNVSLSSGAPIVSAIAPGMAPPSHMSPVGVAGTAGPSATSTPRASVTSLERTGSIDLTQADWSVPHHIKLKYTQMFNTTDRTRTGYLSGAQARNVMVQTKLPQSTLAQIWALSDMDSDGRLGCEEFVLALHLCEQAAVGIPPPTVLPPDLIPPSFRRGVRTSSRTASVSSQGSVQLDQDLSSLSQNTFEDKRKENFEKGQAELERRRKALLDQQRKEAEERERKEREEIERKEKARQEAEKKRMDELEKQMRDQQEKERLMEEERKRQAEQREAARREMERQRQLEWEKQRLQELQNQRQREQENVLKLKAKNQSLTIELSTLNEQVKELSQKICDTRIGVSNVKATIDGMRSTRDSQMQEMSQLKNKLKEQNAKLLALSQEKVKLDAKNRQNLQNNDPQAERTKQAFENKEITIKNLKEKVDDMEHEIDGKMSDIENNNSHLTDLKMQLTELITECEDLYSLYEEKKSKVVALKSSNANTDYTSSWKETTDNWGSNEIENNWHTDDWGSSQAADTVVSSVPAVQTVTSMAGAIKYRALYAFDGRNSDEISIQPGDIIMVPLEQNGEPGWLAGEIRGQTGWFPESYVEPVDGVDVRGSIVPEPAPSYIEELETKRLEGIVEVPETISEVVEPTGTIELEAMNIESDKMDYYIANYQYQSVEQGDLTFNAGDVITVVKKEGDWWTGKIGDRMGIFPSNYVQKVDVSSSTNQTCVEPEIMPVSAVLPPPQDNTQIDNEVSQINENKENEKPDFAAMSANTQTIKGNKKPEIASVIAPYQATSSEQLSLQRGQLIMIRKKTDSGWWEGELQAKGKKRQVGWFPASYVKVLNSSGRTSGRTTPVSTSRIQQEVIIDKVVALYPYTAANPDELSFLKDDIISVTAREEQLWWRGELNGVSGLFPSNYVTPLQQLEFGRVGAFTDQILLDKKRQVCVNELIQTEKAYIDDMTVVHNIFEIPLINSGVISKEEVESIFVNWEDILQCNKNFLKDLLERTNSGSDVIGDIICLHLPRMTAYKTFCSKQLESAALLQRLTETSVAFRDVVKKCQNSVATKGMPLSSFLIKPMQRITKYPLLIAKIIDNTPDNHTDQLYLKEALEVAEKFLTLVNENVRFKENEERLEWMRSCIQMDLNIDFNSSTNKLGPRKLLHFGLLRKVKSGKELIGFLLNDFLLLVQPNKSINSTQFVFQRNNNVIFRAYKQPLLIQELKVTKGSSENVESGTDSNRVLKLQDKKQIISLLTSSVNECNLWLKRIEAAIDAFDKSMVLTKTPLHPRKLYTDNVYCKVMVGYQEQETDVCKDNMSNGNGPQNGIPQVPTLIWNCSMQFYIRSIKEDVLAVAVYEMCPFKPDVFLGRAELRLEEIYRDLQHTNGPLIKKLILHQVESGEVTVKLDLQMFSNNF